MIDFNKITLHLYVALVIQSYKNLNRPCENNMCHIMLVQRNHDFQNIMCYMRLTQRSPAFIK